jgi:hypothetical protein
LTPKELGALSDQYWAAYNKRLNAERAAKELKGIESKLYAQLVTELRSQELTSVGGHDVRLTLTCSTEPVVKDWQAVYDYITANQDFSLMQKRLAAPAIKERWEAGEVIPGVETFEVFKLSKSAL